MNLALDLARQAEALAEVPIGAVIVRDGEILGVGYNQTIGSCDPTAHAEMVAIRAAARRSRPRPRARAVWPMWH